MKCYKLVFSFKHFIKNSGSIILLILLFVYIGFFIYFTLKGISPIKVSISKIIFDDKDVDNKISPFFETNTRNKYKPKDNKSTKGNNPPKKQLVLRKMLIKKEIEKKVEKKEEKADEKKEKILDNKTKNPNQNKVNNIIIVDEPEDDNEKEKEKALKNQGDINIINPSLMKINNNVINNNNKNKDIVNKTNNKTIQIDASGTKSFYLNMNLGSSKKLKLRKDNKHSEKAEVRTLKSKVSKKSKKKEKKKKTNSEGEKTRKVKFKEILESSTSMIEEQIPKKEEITLDDYELNHLEYFDALKLDKRNYCQAYWSVLKRDQNIINTCFAFNDYNLFYVKMAKFIFVIANLMAMNALLFADKSFHKLFISGVHYYFSYQILQIVLSVIITYVVEIILCYLTFTDKYIYEIKSLPKKETNSNKIFSILKCIWNKLLIFYVVALVILIFYWYLISAFCAVYPNTQKIYIIDCLLSFIFFSIIPFIVYAITTLLRVIALKDNERKRLKCLFIIGTSFPLF